MTEGMTAVRDAIRDVPDFPHPGIVFKDITPVLQDPALFATVIEALVSRYRNRDIDQVLAVESRGFIFGAPVATAIGTGFVPMRKPGKLPYETHSESYDLEYGSETMEIHVDGVRPGDRVVIIDDLLATGGTAEASLKLARKLGAEVIELAFMVELGFLNGRRRLPDVPVHSLIVF
jgi:adenine phosphoribosyltransferase